MSTERGPMRAMPGCIYRIPDGRYGMATCAGIYSGVVTLVGGDFPFPGHEERVENLTLLRVKRTPRGKPILNNGIPVPDEG